MIHKQRCWSLRGYRNIRSNIFPFSIQVNYIVVTRSEHSTFLSPEGRLIAPGIFRTAVTLMGMSNIYRDNYYWYFGKRENWFRGGTHALSRWWWWGGDGNHPSHYRHFGILVILINQFPLWKFMMCDANVSFQRRWKPQWESPPRRKKKKDRARSHLYVHPTWRCKVSEYRFIKRFILKKISE